jgi:FkbH-like protein
MMATRTRTGILHEILALRKEGRGAEALHRLQGALRQRRLDPLEIDQAGRFLQQEWARQDQKAAGVRVLLLGQCTTSWLVPALVAVAWGRQARVQIEEGGYDTVLQDLARRPAQDSPDVVILLPWNQRLLGRTDVPPRQRIDEELAFWQEAWHLVHSRHHSRLLQVGYDWVDGGAAGHFLAGQPGGPVWLVREMNAALRERLPAGSFFLDLVQVSGASGRTSFYDMRRYCWTRQPFSEAGIYHLAEHVWAGVQALTVGPKKVLVVDLDNTVWGGVVGETGPHGIVLGDSGDGAAYQAFQRYLKELRSRGVLLAAVSKNNPEDARAPFQLNRDMVLHLDDFAAFEAGWAPKSVMLERVARDLRLGLDSFVFFDDNPAEQEQVRQALPEVEVVAVPSEPAEYIGALVDGLWFEAAAVTGEDRDRADRYQSEQARRQEQWSFASLEDYLRSLQMRAEVRPLDEADLPRVVQLLARTNQFNLTTRRHSREEVQALAGQSGAVALTLRGEDRFGDLGLIAVLLAVPAGDGDEPTVRIDTWLMSCRAIGRTIEHFLFTAFLERCRALGLRKVVGEYIATPKNGLVKGLYKELGFALLSADGAGASRYELVLEEARPPVTFVTAKG